MYSECLLEEYSKKFGRVLQRFYTSFIMVKLDESIVDIRCVARLFKYKFKQLTTKVMLPKLLYSNENFLQVYSTSFHHELILFPIEYTSLLFYTSLSAVN